MGNPYFLQNPFWTPNFQQAGINPIFASALASEFDASQRQAIIQSFQTPPLDSIFSQENPRSAAYYQQLEAYVDKNVKDGKPLPGIYQNDETFATYLAKYQILDDHKISRFEYDWLATSTPPYIQAVDRIMNQQGVPVSLETPNGTYTLTPSTEAQPPAETTPPAARPEPHTQPTAAEIERNA